MEESFDAVEVSSCLACESLEGGSVASSLVLDSSEARVGSGVSEDPDSAWPVSEGLSGFSWVASVAFCSSFNSSR